MPRIAFIFVIALFLTPFSASADTIDACANQTNGNLRLVADPGQCRNNEAPILLESDGAGTGTALAVFDGDGNEVGLFIAGARAGELLVQRYAHLSPDHMKRIASLTLRRPAAEVLEIAQGRNG